MNTAKRFNLIIAILMTAMLFLTINCSAQQRQGKGQGQPPIPDESQITKMVKDLSAELSLTETQETEIHTLYAQHFAKVQSSMSSGERPNREEMESLREEFQDDVKSVLNDEQQDLYDEHIEKNRPQQGQRRQRPSNNR